MYGGAGLSRTRVALLAHHLDDKPLRPLAIPLAVEDPLPGTQVQPPLGDGDDHLMPDGEAPQVGGPVVLARPVVAVVVAPGRMAVPRRDVARAPVPEVRPEPASAGV